MNTMMLRLYASAIVYNVNTQFNTEPKIVAMMMKCRDRTRTREMNHISVCTVCGLYLHVFT